MADFFVWTKPVARTTHRCSVCHRRINPRETYAHCKGLVDGAFAVWRECLHCNSMIELYRIEDLDGNRPGLDTVEDFEFASITGLRHRAQFMKRWQRADGELLDVPSVTGAMPMGIRTHDESNAIKEQS